MTDRKRLACGHLASGARSDGQCFYATCPGRDDLLLEIKDWKWKYDSTKVALREAERESDLYAEKWLNARGRLVEAERERDEALNEGLRATAELGDHLRAASEEIKRLREALEWYAPRGAWGQRAREALDTD